MFKKSMLIIISMMAFVFFSVSVQAKSQCSGLSKSVCAVNDTCTWRKSSVDKNGKKTKAHCRALPGKSKAKKTSKSSSSKSKPETKSTTKSDKSKASSSKKTKTKKTTKTKVKTKDKTKKKAAKKKAAKKKSTKNSKS